MTCIPPPKRQVVSDRFAHCSGAFLLATAIIAAAASFAPWHLSRTAFWYDESMQFWMSLGLDGFGAPLAARGTAGDILKQNAIANLDPGGFSLLLGLWTTFGTSETWQRALPLTFFLAGIVGLGLLAWTWRRSIAFAATAAMVPAAFPLLLDYSVEVRAYSMEFAGVVFGSLMLARLLRAPGFRSALLTGSVFACFLTARYSYFLFTAAVGITLAFGWRNKRPLSLLAGFVAPLAVSGVLILVVTFLPQYRARISYEGGALLAYLRPATAAGKSAGELAAMAAANLLHPAGLPLSLLALLGVTALVTSSWRDRPPRGSVSAETALFGVLALAALILTALVWPWHPWSMTTKWSLWLHALSAVAVIRLAASVLDHVGPPGLSAWENSRWLTGGILVAFLVLDLRFASYRRPEGNTIVPVLRYLEQADVGAGTVAVDGSWYPTLRYFYEYGRFARSRLYPASFRLPDWGGPKPLVAPPQTRFLITWRSAAAMQAEFPQARVVVDPALPSQLLRIEPAATPRSDPRLE